MAKYYGLVSGLPVLTAEMAKPPYTAEEFYHELQPVLSTADRQLLEALRAVRQIDQTLGHSSVGLHRDDLLMELEGELIRKVGSEGQRKTYLIALKFAQYTLLSRSNPERPLLLLDDIFDKLDAARVERIIRLVGGSDFGQIFITDTNRKYLDEIIESWGEDYRLFEVQEGVITQTAGDATE